jgi:hypothetical protein
MIELPILTKDDDIFIGKVNLKAWSGFISSKWFLLPKNSESEDCDGIVKITLHCKSDNVESPSEFQNRALVYLIENQEEMQAKIITALITEFPKIAKNCDYLDSKDNELPIVTELVQLKKLIGLSTIHINDKEKDGIAYVGYQFRCVWDGEHGLGIMTHRDRIIEIGGADSSFAWVNDPEK